MNLAGRITALLAALAMLSGASIALTAVDYARGMRATRSVWLELGSVQLRDGDTREALVAFQLRNQSASKFKVETFDFTLYLNGNFMGRNYAPFSEQTLDGFEDVMMDFVIPIQSSYSRYIEQAQLQEDFSWSVSGRCTLSLPPKEKRIWLIVREHWRGEE